MKRAGAPTGDVHENKWKYLSLSIRHSTMSHLCVIMNVPTPTHSYAGCHSGFYQFSAEKDSQKKRIVFFLLFSNYFPERFRLYSSRENGEKDAKKKCSRKADVGSGVLTAQVMMTPDDCGSENNICLSQIFRTAVCLNVPGNKMLHTTLVKFVDAK